MALISAPTLLDFSQMNFIGNHPDPAYFTVFYIGLAITLLSMTVLLFLSFREYKQKRDLQKSLDIMGKV